MFEERAIPQPPREVAYPGSMQPGVTLWQYETVTLDVSKPDDAKRLSSILTLAGTGVVVMHTYKLLESPEGLKAFVVFATQALITKDDCRQRQATLLSQILPTQAVQPR